jgi:NAD(P)-dependent dehydrogenase (short-subunit alcohol dehydrogenase family)
LAELQELFKFTGRVAIVTGASSGLGAGFAESLARAGAKLMLAARRRERLESLAARLREEGAQVEVCPCDVARAEDAEQLVRSTRERFGSVDILVNNAGITATVPAEDEQPAEFRRVLDVNLTGVFLCAQSAGRVMLAQGRGSIINVASILGLVGSGQIPQASYAAAKGGVVNLTRELAAQWARRGVRVNALAPGWFPSEMTEDMFEDPRALAWVKKRCPMGRPGQAHELNGPMLFLASDASSYVTGQTLAVDGGWTII